MRRVFDSGNEGEGTMGDHQWSRVNYVDKYRSEWVSRQGTRFAERWFLNRES